MNETHIGSTSCIGNKFLEKVQGEVFNLDPESPEEAKDLWLNEGKNLINSLPGFEEAVIEATLREDGFNYYLTATFKDEETYDKFEELIEQMINCEGPLEPISLILSGDFGEWPEEVSDCPDFFFSNITLW